AGPFRAGRLPGRASVGGQAGRRRAGRTFPGRARQPPPGVGPDHRAVAVVLRELAAPRAYDEGEAMKKLLVILLLILIGYLLWRWWHWHDQQGARGHGPALVYDRPLGGHMPRGQAASLQVVAA